MRRSVEGAFAELSICHLHLEGELHKLCACVCVIIMVLLSVLESSTTFFFFFYMNQIFVNFCEYFSICS